jgi:uncharacterized protein YhhL (DUF1145 family)
MSKEPFVLFRKSVAWPLFIAAIFAAELALGWCVYHTYNVATAYTALCGVPLLAVVDYLARQGNGDVRPRWYRRYLAWWCLVPFAAALAGSFWVHDDKRRESLDDLRQLALDVRREVSKDAPAGKTWGNLRFGDGSTGPVPPGASDVALARVLTEIGWLACQPETTTITGADINSTVSTMFKERFTDGTEHAALSELKGEPSLVLEQGRRFGELARVVGRDLRLACGDDRIVYERARDDTLLSFGLALAIQALFVLWIPVMLAITIARAYRRDRRPSPRGVSESLHGRDNRILAEDRYMFVPRFCFAALLVLGTNYVFSPFGLKATYIMAIVDEHALPGHPTWVLWSTSFAAVPVIVVGFVGFLLYALVTASQRFALDDLDDQAVLSLLVRGLVVILLCFALSSSPMNETVSRIFVFIAGVFPLRALEALAKKVNIAIDPDFDGTVSSFDGLASLDPSKVFALRSAGIQSTYDLAATPIEEIAERVRIDPRLLGRAVDRAILIDAIGLELAKRLEPFAITSATELVALKGKMPELVEVPRGDHGFPEPCPTPPAPSTQLRDAAERCAERLASDLRVALVRSWLAGAPYFEELHLDPAIEVMLRAAGFQSTEQLLAVPLVEVAHRSHLEPCALGMVLDTALLVNAVGKGNAQQLARLNITSATHLVEHGTAEAPDIQSILGEAFAPVLDRLSRDPRVAEVRRWLSCAPQMPSPLPRPPTSPPGPPSEPA